MGWRERTAGEPVAQGRRGPRRSARPDRRPSSDRACAWASLAVVTGSAPAHRFPLARRRGGRDLLDIEDTDRKPIVAGTRIHAAAAGLNARTRGGSDPLAGARFYGATLPAAFDVKAQKVLDNAPKAC